MYLTVAIDFDGTVVEHDYPDVGKDVPGAVSCLRELARRGVRIILWTMRDGPELADAVAWYRERDIPLFGINENPDQRSWTGSPKAYAHVYVDDAALGCPLVRPERGRRYVDWEVVGPELMARADRTLHTRMVMALTEL